MQLTPVSGLIPAPVQAPSAVVFDQVTWSGSTMMVRWRAQNTTAPDSGAILFYGWQTSTNGSTWGTEVFANDTYCDEVGIASGSQYARARAYALTSSGTTPAPSSWVTSSAQAYASSPYGGSVSAPVTLTAPNASTTPLTLVGAASQAADLLDINDSSGYNLFSMNSAGNLTLGVPGSLGSMQFVVKSSANTPWIGMYDDNNSLYYGISARLPGPSGTTTLGGFYHGMGVGGASSGAGNAIFGVLNSGQLFCGIGHASFTIYDNNTIVTYFNTLDDGAGQMTLGASTAGSTPLTIKAAASQTSNLLDILNSSGATLSSIGPNGVLSPSALPVATSGAFGAVKPDNSTITISGGVISASGGGSSPTRASTALTSSSLAPNAADSSKTLGIGKFAQIYSVGTSAAAAVRLYSTSAARSADLGRSVGAPIPLNAGVILETIASAGSLGPFLRTVAATNDDTTPNSYVYATIINLSGTAQAITATFEYLTLEN